LVAWIVEKFGGQIPRTESQFLPNEMAEQAVNCDLSSGTLIGLPVPILVKDLSSIIGDVKRAHRIPNPDDPAGADTWLPLPSPYSSVVRSPLANDTSHRYYWTNPGDKAPHWNTFDRIANGDPNYDLGIVQPVNGVGPGNVPVSPLTVTTVGGDTSAPDVSRSYVYTLVNEFGEESAPSLPSDVVSGHPNASWHIAGLPTTAPPNPEGLNYPPAVKLNLYRTITGQTTGGNFFLLTSFDFASSPPPDPYADGTADFVIVNNLTLISTNFANPPEGLDGLIGLSGGMIVGFTGNTVHFCEPNRPHAWPAAYDQSMQYEIVGLGVWQQSLIVLTKGFPTTMSGGTPANMTPTQVRVAEPCIARGSIVTDLMGVYYASQNGLVMLNYYGMQNQTLTMVDKNIWLSRYRATSIIACRHRAQYLAINGLGTGFMIDYTEPRLGFMDLNTFFGAECVWNDEYSGDAYICANKKIYRWDSPGVTGLTYRWRSKVFSQPAPINVGAIQISLDPTVHNPPSGAPPPLDNGDSSMVLPEGVNALFRLYIGPGYLKMTRHLTKTREIFRAPSGFKAFNWQFEVVSRVKIHSVELATTMKELRGV
jgi:hypothetical protein